MRAGWEAAGLVVLGGVKDEFAQEFAGGGVDDGDLQVLDQEQDAGSGVGSPDADVVQAAGAAQGDRAGVVDAVGADPVVRIAAAVRRPPHHRPLKGSDRRNASPGWWIVMADPEGDEFCLELGE